MNMQEKLGAYLTEQRGLAKAAHNNASTCGHPCLRYLFYRRHPDHWEYASRYSVDTMFIFWNGEQTERSVIGLLADAGYVITNQQQYFFDKALDLSGKLDCEIDNIPTEIKALQGYVWDKINTSDDFLRFPDSQYWYRNYFHQLNMYLYLSNKEIGQFVLFNKSNGKVKNIPFSLNWDMADDIATRLGIVNEALKKNLLPPLVKQGNTNSGNVDICPKCSFYAHCAPPLNYGEGVDASDIPEGVEEILDEMNALSESNARYKELEKQLNELIRGRSFVTGRYIVTGKWVTTTTYPPDKTKQPKIGEYWRKKITVIGQE